MKTKDKPAIRTAVEIGIKITQNEPGMVYPTPIASIEIVPHPTAEDDCDAVLTVADRYMPEFDVDDWTSKLRRDQNLKCSAYTILAAAVEELANRIRNARDQWLRDK